MGLECLALYFILFYFITCTAARDGLLQPPLSLVSPHIYILGREAGCGGIQLCLQNKRRCSFHHSSTSRGRYDKSLSPTAALGAHGLATTLPSWASDSVVRCIWYRE
ncbi:hypothetical protein LY78DRAFT_192840 [Colletotrichum sublineola]|nr:hypothetical protein LY78DRAFT_192840 [Colletotrichum sublineola]